MTETLSLRALLRLDALIGLACGLALSLGAAPLGALFGLPPGLLLGAGLALFPCAGLMALAAQRLSRPLVALALAEARVLHLALLSWRRPTDVPEGATGFAYHRYLAPMLWVLLTLQMIELSVVHLLVMLWSPTVAWVLLALSVWGVLWIVALFKSLRLRPVLLTDKGVRGRAGLLIDVLVPFDRIAAVRGPSDAAEVKAKTTLNAALLAWPDIVFDLHEPMRVSGPLGRERLVDKVAFKLDDPAAFHEQLSRLR